VRYYYHKKATAEESCGLSIYRLKKYGMLSGRTYETISWTSRMTGKTTTVLLEGDLTGGPYIRFAYTVTDRKGNKTDFGYEVNLVTTRCNFGGVRYWFECPSCGRRVGVLYLAPGDTYFRCRHCNNLSYHSRNGANVYVIFGMLDRKIKKLRSEIKRWTWRGRPTRKVRRLQALQRKMGILSGPISAQMEKMRARLR